MLDVAPMFQETQETMILCSFNLCTGNDQNIDSFCRDELARNSFTNVEAKMVLR